MPYSKSTSGANLFRQLSVYKNNMEQDQATSQAYKKAKHDLGQWLGETFEVNSDDIFSFAGKLLASESTCAKVYVTNIKESPEAFVRAMIRSSLRLDSIDFSKCYFPLVLKLIVDDRIKESLEVKDRIDVECLQALLHDEVELSYTRLCTSPSLT
jgi:hypothetical protein